MSMTIFEEDRVVQDNPPKNDRSWGSFSWWNVVFIALVIFIVLAILASVLWLMFTPTPTENTREAASIIDTEISESLESAHAFRIVNTNETSLLIVETEENTCKFFRSLPNGLYQSFESEGRVSPLLLDFEAVNYRQAFPIGNDPAFNYYHSEEELQRGIALNLSIGQNFNGDPRAIELTGKRSVNKDIGNTSFCF